MAYATTTPILLSTLSFFFVAIFFFPRLCQSRNNTPYDTCAPSTCGNITITFPFALRTSTSICSLPEYDIACDDTVSQATIILSQRPYQVIKLDNFSNSIVISDNNLVRDLGLRDCSNMQSLSVSISNIAPLALPLWTTYLNFYRCSQGVDLSADFVKRVRNYNECGDHDRLYLAGNYTDLLDLDVPSTPRGCRYIRVPILRGSLRGLENQTSPWKDLDWTALLGVLRKGFPLEWPEISNCSLCRNRGERCGFEENSGSVVCFSKDASGQSQTGTGSKSSRWKVIVGVIVPSTSIVLATTVILLIFKFKHRAMSIFNKDHYLQSKSRTEKNDRNVEEFIKNYRSMLVTKYSYTDIHKMTNGFKEKLGEGSYGNVFKGKLNDGRLVAAKMLEKSKDSGQEDFINEVATIGTIHHVNVIRLLGFCWEGSRRALVYEFMTNGSLGDLISKKDATHVLEWPKLLEIAVGIAHGIGYLHQGCDTKILHLDIKPQNVLLDENYHPKISDFGLAKSYSRNHSVVSMTGAKGTIGYIAPEIFLRNLGRVSHKSDVYSYGMLLLEMVGGRKNVENSTENSSTMYFPDWIYKQLDGERGMELVHSIVEEDSSIVKKIAMVGLWCVQTNPKDRPSMSEVVEMLGGSLERIEMPPKPFLFSPPQLQTGNEISILESDTNELPIMFDST